MADDYPAKGLAWNEADLSLLRGEIERAVPVTAIALQLGRTTEAVRAKAVKEGIIVTNPRRERPRKKRFSNLFGD